MKLRTAALFLSLTLATGLATAETCVYPQAPQAMPNGSKATKDEMLAAQGVVKEYTRSVEQTYLPCLEKDKAAAIAELDPKAADYESVKRAIELLHAKKHNAAFDELNATVARFNQEIAAFKAQSAK